MKLSAVVYALKRGIVNFFCLGLDVLLQLFQSTPYKKSTKPVVYVLRLDAIGDFVLWSSCMGSYRQLFPKEKFHLVLLGHVVWKDLALEMKIFDEVIGMDRKKFMLDPTYRIDIWPKIKKYECHTIIYHTYSREFASGDLIVRRMKASNKIGIVSDNAIDTAFWTNWGSRWYTQLENPSITHPHELIKNQSFVSSLGLPHTQLTLSNFEIKDCPCDEIPLPDNYFILFPGARVGLRKWSEQNYLSIAEKIVSHTNWKCVICGGVDENTIAEYIQKNTSIEVINLCGATSLLQLVGIIKKSKFLLGNETSGVHIAAAVQTPSICILGGGHFGRFVPYPEQLDLPYKPIPVYEHMECFGCDWNCIYQVSKATTVPCIRQISVDKVWDTTRQLVDVLKTN